MFFEIEDIFAKQNENEWATDFQDTYYKNTESEEKQNG